ncbi:hypothetical protein [Dictyobacter arantiisoli]|uniref:Uncharacterized protein n=1 Tax=Dictyobacter arantiisoli TaxID=2014874 RepID=A0A5A5TD01_9CHLR|nr:hypothetical protein [Dictyobacter arantiisoli]GCF09400.1 hypothetical protein KDI_29640 [Dictyobacter arantiisoli]
MRQESADLKQEVLVDMLQSSLQIRFPALLPVLEEHIQTPLADEVLRTLAITIGMVAKTEDEARQLLLKAWHSQ